MDSRLYSKCEVIWNVYSRIVDDNDEPWEDRLTDWAYINDVGIPIASVVSTGYVSEITDRGVQAVNKTWLDLCRIVMVDSDEQYDFFDDMLEIGAIDE